MGMVEENAITADTTWKDLKRSIEEEDAYKAMDGQPGGARDVFDDIVADLRRQVRFRTCHLIFFLYFLKCCEAVVFVAVVFLARKFSCFRLRRRFASTVLVLLLQLCVES